MDVWNDAGNFKNVYYTSALRVVAPSPGNGKNGTPRFHNPRIQGKGSCCHSQMKQYAFWALQVHLKTGTQHPILMTLKDDWYITGVTLSEDEWPASYKYGIYNTQSQTFVAYEEEENRLLLHQNENTGKTISHDGFVRINFKPFKGTGVNIPVFSLRSQKVLE